MTTYAIADQVPDGCDYLTAGKEYEVVDVLSEDEGIFSFFDDDGDYRHAVFDGCGHLNGGNWRRVEK